MPRPKSDLKLMTLKLGDDDREALAQLTKAHRTNANEMLRILIRAEVKRAERRANRA